MELDSTAGTAARLEMVKWHILRSDGQRSGLWGRAAAILGADALVVAGAAVLLAVGGTAPVPARVSALVAMACVLTSTAYAASALAVVRTGAASPANPPLIFSLPDTTGVLGSYGDFRGVVTSQTLDDQLEAAVAELWRIGLFHRRRIQQLRWCVRWLLFSIGGLMVSAVLSVLPR